MSPTIVTKDGELFMVIGIPGSRAIINTVPQTIIHAVEFGMNAQEVTDAGPIHHQWLPDRIQYEQNDFSPDTLEMLKQRGHQLEPTQALGCAQVIIYNKEENVPGGGSDRRRHDGGVAIH